MGIGTCRRALGILMICLVYGSTLIDAAAEEPNKSEMDKLITTFLRGDADKEQLLAAGMSGINAIERFLSAPCDMDKKEMLKWLKQLGHERFRFRKKATERLSQLPPSNLPVLKALSETTTDPEVRVRIRKVIENVQRFSKRRKLLVPALHTLYANNAKAVVESRLPLVQKDPKNMRAVYAVNKVPFAQVWKLLESKSDDLKLTYLMLKFYAGDSEEAKKKLKAYLAKDVLRIAKATWWPIELEPLKKDGAYGWTTRAQSISGNTATGLIRMGVRLPSDSTVSERGKWTHIFQWSGVHYIFRFPTYCSKEVVGYARIHAEPPEVSGWMKGIEKKISKPRGRCDTFRGIPKTARLPMAHIPGRESLDWHLGKRYEWAKPLFPKELADALTFKENKHGVPKVDPAPSKEKE